MRRKRFTFVSALSLLLCLAVCGLWVRSCYVRDSVGTCYIAGGGFHWRVVESYGGRVHVVRIQYPNGDRRRFDTYPLRLASVAAPGGATLAGAYGGRSSVSREFLGFATVSGDYYDGGASEGSFAAWAWPIEATVIPLWPAALAAAALPVAWLRKHFRGRRRDRHGLCPSCGYDLRATPDRCPECGTEGTGLNHEGTKLTKR
jgi:hypothetical protein